MTTPTVEKLLNDLDMAAHILAGTDLVTTSEDTVKLLEPILMPYLRLPKE